MLTEIDVFAMKSVMLRSARISTFFSFMALTASCLLELSQAARAVSSEAARKGERAGCGVDTTGSGPHPVVASPLRSRNGNRMRIFDAAQAAKSPRFDLQGCQRKPTSTNGTHPVIHHHLYWRTFMLRNMLFAAVLTLSAFAATGAHAAAGQGDQPRFASAGGSYGFTVYPQCRTPAQLASLYCRKSCVGFAPGSCFLSYHNLQNSDRRNRATETKGYAQGKFRSK
jgi:hypothetical protein